MVEVTLMSSQFDQGSVFSLENRWHEQKQIIYLNGNFQILDLC